MNHQASPAFWRLYEALSPEIRAQADVAFRRLRQNPRHPSLHLKKVGRFWSVRVGADHRVLAVQEGSNLAWFWIGRHDEYERLVRDR